MNNLTAQIDQVASDLENQAPQVSLMLDRISDFIEKTAVEDSKAGTKLYETVNKEVADFKKHLKTLEDLGGKVGYLIDEVVDLAKKAHNEGEDYYGEDYISQTFPRESWGKIEGGSDLLELIDVLKDLETKYTRHKKDLQDELRKKEAQVC